MGVSELVPRTRHLRGRTWHGVRQVQQGAGANVCFSSCAAAARAHSQCAWQNEWLEALEGIKDDLQTVIAEQASDTVDHQRTLKWYNLRYPEEQADIQNPGTIRPITEILNTANDFFEFTQVSDAPWPHQKLFELNLTLWLTRCARRQQSFGAWCVRWCFLLSQSLVASLLLCRRKFPGE